MPALKDKAITLLGSANKILNAGATIFTTPPGKSTVLTHVTISNPAASIAAATSINFGVYGGTSQVINCSGVTATGMCLASAFSGAGTIATANTAIALAVTTGAAQTADIRIFGYTY